MTHTKRSRARERRRLATVIWTLGIAGAAGVLGGCRTAAIDPVAIQDAQLAAQVKTALVNDRDLGATTIEVSVARGVARLAGSVPTQMLADKAVTIARGVQGVSAVRSELRVGAVESPPPVEVASPRESGTADDLFERQADRRFLAAGVSFGWSGPRMASLRSRASAGPLVRLGSGRGFGPTLALNWFQTVLPAISPGQVVISRIRVRPIMAGVSYTVASDRVSVSPSLVAGIAFNSLSIEETGAVDRVAVEVDRSFVWRPGVSAWFDVNGRIALNLSAGYIVTRLHVTFLEEGRFVKHHLPGDTTIIHAGIAYKLF
jgi:hyperosmotically inducible protein